MVSYYFYSRSVDVGPLLKWAGQQAEPTATAMVHEAQKDDFDMGNVDTDPEVRAHHLWGFLNISFIEDA